MYAKQSVRTCSFYPYWRSQQAKSSGPMMAYDASYAESRRARDTEPVAEPGNNDAIRAIVAGYLKTCRPMRLCNSTTRSANSTQLVPRIKAKRAQRKGNAGSRERRRAARVLRQASAGWTTQHKRRLVANRSKERRHVREVFRIAG